MYTVIGGKFKFQAQDSFLEYFYFGDLKNEFALSEKKPPLAGVVSLLRAQTDRHTSRFITEICYDSQSRLFLTD